MLSCFPIVTIEIAAIGQQQKQFVHDPESLLRIAADFELVTGASGLAVAIGYRKLGYEAKGPLRIEAKVFEGRRQAGHGIRYAIAEHARQESES